MRKHLFGAILFCVIVGVAIFVNLFALPKPLPVFESTDCVFIFEPGLENDQKKLGEVKLKYVIFYSEIQKFKAVIKLESFKYEKENITLHFFTKNKNSARYLFSQQFRPIVSTTGSVYTNLVEIKRLTELKSLQNVFVTAKFESDYQENTIPNFDSKFAVPISINNDKN